MTNWDKKLETGIKEIDTQHKRLFEIIAKLKAFVDKGDGGRATIPTLTELGKYAKEHFAFEEALLHNLDPKDLVLHIKGHEVFVEKLNGYLLQAQNTSWEKLSTELVDFLQDWLVHHILEQDLKDLA